MDPKTLDDSENWNLYYSYSYKEDILNQVTARQLNLYVSTSFSFKNYGASLIRALDGDALDLFFVIAFTWFGNWFL